MTNYGGYGECPLCHSSNVWQESADVGVGVIYGPAYCNDCGWDSDTTCGPLIDETDIPSIHDDSSLDDLGAADLENLLT